MPRRTTRPPLPAAALLALAAALPASCATTPGSASAPRGESAASPDGPAAEEPSARGIQAGWMDPRGARKPGQVDSLTLVGESTPEGRKIRRGLASMPGGKVIDDGSAADLAAAFGQAGFDRYAVKANPNDAPRGALGVVWISRGNGYESLFFMPGDRLDPGTERRPDVYDALKKLIWSIHIRTPGSMVKASQGWSGDDLLHQKPGDDR